MIDTTPPPAPSDLRVDRIGDGRIALSWSAPTDSTDWRFFVLYRAEGDQDPVPIDTLYQAGFEDIGLEYETEYTYYVTSVDPAGNESLPSVQVRGQPLNTLAPLAPVRLRAVAHNIEILDQLEIALDWDPNAESDLKEYRVYRAESEESSSAVLYATVERPRLIDREIEVGQRYWYWVTAVDLGSKESPRSNAASDVALPVPELEFPVDGEIASSTPRFRWRSVPEAVAYRVVVTTAPTSGEISDMPLVSDTTAAFQGRMQTNGKRMNLESGQVYYWKVSASSLPDGTENSVSRVERFKVR